MSQLSFPWGCHLLALAEPVALQEARAESNLSLGAKALQFEVAIRSGPWQLQKYGVKRDVMLSRVHVAAEVFLQMQSKLQIELLRYARSMTAANHMKAVAYVEYSNYDETKMRLKVQWPDVSQGEIEVSNVYVLLSSYVML